MLVVRTPPGNLHHQRRWFLLLYRLRGSLGILLHTGRKKIAALIICGTGHRPEDIRETESEIRAKIRSALLELSPSTVITGMASGFDLYLGGEAIDMGIETWAARPWAKHTPRRSEDAEYARIIAGASKVIDVNVSAVYLGPWLYHDRNHWMVDNADKVLAYWSGKESGGTYECIKYAYSKNKGMWNCYDTLRVIG